jgi:hypothetical protein
MHLTHCYHILFVSGVNSGVMLMNLTRMRAFSWTDYVVPIYKEYKLKITWGDQDIINIIFHFHPGNFMESSSQAQQTVVDLGFQYGLPPFFMVFGHCLPVFCLHYIQIIPSGWEFDCTVFSTNLFFMGLGCQHDTQPLVCRTRVSLCLEPQS